MPKNIIADTGFWIAYFEERDQHHAAAHEFSKHVFKNKIICPFPSLYEFLNTRFARNSKRIEKYKEILSKLDIEYIYDDKYRKNDKNHIVSDFISLNMLSLNTRTRKPKYMSLVDLIINRIIEDVNVKIDYMATFNLDDFARTCQKRNIEFLQNIR
jgi:predicted nucleic acid-binding protein